MVLENCETILKSPESFFGDMADNVNEVLARGNREPLLKMAALLHDIGKPSTRGLDEGSGRITFYGHDAEGAKIVEDIARRLGFGEKDRRYLKLLVEEHLHVLNLSSPEVKRGTLAGWFRRHGDDCIPVLILGMSDIKGGTLGPDSSEAGIRNQLAWSRETARDYFVSARKELNRKELIAMGVSSGPEMGKLIAKVHQAQDRGEVNTKSEALELLKGLISQ